MKSIRCIASAILACFLVTPLMAQPVQTYTVHDWEPGDVFFTTIAIDKYLPINGAIVETRVVFTLHDVPGMDGDIVLDAADIYVVVATEVFDPAFPDTSFEVFARFDGDLHLEFSGTGGPMSASVVTHALDGHVVSFVDPFDGSGLVSGWSVTMGSDVPALYGPITGTVEVDYIPTVPLCPCEMTGDSPPNVDVFDLLEYLDAWFAGELSANLNTDEVVDVFDLLEYLDCWFSAGTTLCS